VSLVIPPVETSDPFSLQPLLPSDLFSLQTPSPANPTIRLPTRSSWYLPLLLFNSSCRPLSFVNKKQLSLTVFRPWSQQDHVPDEISTTVTKHRLNTHLQPKYPNPEAAEETQTVYHQARLRVGELKDGTTILEEQDVVLTERRTIWGPRRECKLVGVEANGHADVLVGS